MHRLLRIALFQRGCKTFSIKRLKLKNAEVLFTFFILTRHKLIKLFLFIGCERTNSSLFNRLINNDESSKRKDEHMPNNRFQVLSTLSF